MDPLAEWLWTAASKAGPFAAALALVWGVSQYKRAEQERAERIKLQELINGTEGNPGLVERTINAINNAANSTNSMTDMVRPLVAAVLEKAAGK